MCGFIRCRFHKRAKDRGAVILSELMLKLCVDAMRGFRVNARWKVLYRSDV